MLLEEIAGRLDFMLATCRLFAAIRTGQESIGEPSEGDPRGGG
jgi:hypothetical protein